MARIRKRLLAGTAACITLLLAQPSLAKTSTSTFHITANVPSSCYLVASDLAFGDIAPALSAPVDATGGLSVTCTLGTAYSVSLSGGATPSTTVAARKMQNGVNLLAYNLYTNAARTTVWGDGTSSSVAVSGVGSGEAQPLSLYGRIAGNQTDIAAGNFLDTITATITY